MRSCAAAGAARQLGLNEAAIHAGTPFAIINVDLYVDSDLVTTYSCDGLIVSTPVGSTCIASRLAGRHSHVLPPNLRNAQGAYSVGQKLLHKAAARLRDMKFWSRRLSIAVKLIGHEPWDVYSRIHECQDSLTFTEIFCELWREYPQGASPIQVSIVLSDLVPDADRNFSFF